MIGPAAQAIGQEGRVKIAGLHAGILTGWRLVLSPTTKHEETGLPAYTLFGEGHLLRFFLGTAGSAVRVRVMPTPTPFRIGRPKPPTARPFVVVGKLFSITPTRIVLSEGAIEPAHG